MKKFLIIFINILLLSSCANYINKMHQDLDKAEGRTRRSRKYDTFSQFRNNKPSPNKISTQSKKNLIPSIRRNYQPVQKKRFKADDLTDTKNEGSLWAGSGNENYLFTKNKWKRNGDIVLVNVKGRLKNDITAELKRSFPAMPKKKKIADKKPATPEAPKPQENDQVAEDNDKTHDKISSVIVEEISKDHLLVRGQKFLLFRKRKHLVELQALIARRDIKDDDTIDSTQFLESSVSILR